MSHKASPIRIFKKVIQFIIGHIFASIVLIVAPPSFIIFVAITQLYKWIIIVLSKCVMPTSRILSAVDGGLAMGTANKDSHSYITFKLVVEGYLSVEKVREEWIERIMKKQFPNGKLQFPQLQQYVRKFGGYNFWKWDRFFDIKNYIFPHSKNRDEIVDKFKLLVVRTEFQERVYPKSHGLWEMLIVNNYRHNNSPEDKECTVLLFKFHHAIADGFSVVKLFWVHLAGYTLDKPDKSERKFPSLPTRVLNSFLLIFSLAKMIYVYPFRLIYDSDKFFDKHEWHPPPMEKDRKYDLWIPEPINKERLNEIKMVHGVSMVSVLMTVVLGGMRRMMIQKKLNLPKFVRVVFPIPLPNHPDYLTNHMTAVEVQAPFYATDPVKRLLETNKLIKEAVHGPYPIFIKLLMPFASNVPYWLTRNAEQATASVIMPSVPIPRHGSSLFGFPLVSLDSVAYVTRMNCGLNVSILGKDEYFYLSLQVRSSLLNTPDEIRDMEQHILDELESLSASSDFVWSTRL